MCRVFGTKWSRRGTVYCPFRPPGRPTTRAPPHGRVVPKGSKKGEGIMERKHQPQTNGNARPERNKVKLDRRYGEIGISAVAAAVRGRGEKQEQSVPGSTLVLAETD